MPKSRETAWELDGDRVAASADGSYIAGLPGLWRDGEAIHPEALGFTVEGFRELVADLDLPLREVKVAEGSALRSFTPPDDRLPSSPVGAVASPLANVEVDAGEPDGPTIGDEVTFERARAAMAGEAEEEEV